MHAGCCRRRLHRLLPHGIDRQRVRIRRNRRIGAREAPHRLTTRVGDLDDDGPGRCALQVVIDDGARGRILGFRLVLLRRRAVVGVGRQQHRFARLEQEGVRGGDVVVDLPERADVVQDPDAAAVRADDQIVAVNREVAHGRGRQVQLQRLPVVAVVERDEDAELGAGVEQTAPLRILFDRLQVDAGRKTARDLLPRLAGIARAVDVRFVVLEPMTIDRRVRLVRVEVRRLHHDDLAPRRQLARCDVLPALAFVGRDFDQPIVGADP